MASIYSLSNIFQSVASSEFPYQNRSYTYINTNANVKKCLITADNVNQQELYLFSVFLNAIEMAAEDLNNFGFATYTDGVFTGFAPGFFGINNDGVMGLVLGSKSKQTFNGVTPSEVFIPCEVELQKVPNGKKTIEKYVYMLNGTPIELVEKVDNNGKGTDKYYIALNTTDANIDYTFTFPFLIDKTIGFKPGQIMEAWRGGYFIDCLRKFGSGSKNIWLQSNKAFTRHFEAKSFPAKGITIIAKAGELKFTPAGAYENVKSDIWKSCWQIVASSHPELLVRYFDKKEELYTTLGESNRIEFSSAKTNNEGYKFFIDKGVDSYQGVVVIRIVSASRINLEHSPVNTCTNNPEMMLDVINTYAPIQNQDELKNILLSELGGDESDFIKGSLVKGATAEMAQYLKPLPSNDDTWIKEYKRALDSVMPDQSTRHDALAAFDTTTAVIESDEYPPY